MQQVIANGNNTEDTWRYNAIGPLWMNMAYTIRFLHFVSCSFPAFVICEDPFSIEIFASTVELRSRFSPSKVPWWLTELGYICQPKNHVQWQRHHIFQKIEHGNLFVVATKKGLDLPLQPTWSTAVILCRPHWHHPTEKGHVLRSCLLIVAADGTKVGLPKNKRESSFPTTSFQGQAFSFR